MDVMFTKLEIIKYLKKNASDFYATIEQLYTVCESLLAEIPKTFSNYTLHDIGHSIRVISYMNDLVKNRLERFSHLHLALIVYVGLLHDTGMVVSDEEKEKLYREFQINNKGFKDLLEKDKVQYLQDFIRKNHAKRVNAVLEHKINHDTKIKSLLYCGETKSYDLSKLVSGICQSHYEDCDWITKNLDDYLFYGNYKINPRHIALLLRIGDALDIDDRRAPYVLYRLLNPQGYSNSEWRKHIPITNYDKISKSSHLYEITFSGECADPEIYRKITDYIDWFQNDLQKANMISGESEEYKLNIQVPVNVKIKTKGFVATSLRFNLEYRRVVKLLMGEKIYGSKKDGLRELLQNAIDAVLLMQNIEATNPYQSYVPMIGIEIREPENQFIVFDNGVGMSESILQKYFFNIGNSYYTSNEFNSEGYEYKPIGHFGIGFLACFMLSPKVRLETQYYKNSEVIRMSFDKDSPYVTKYDRNEEKFPLGHGTKIIMDYDQIVPKIFENEQNITDYVKKLLVNNEYEFSFIHHERAEVPLKKLEKRYSKHNETFEYEYQIGPISNIKFDVFDYFGNNENVYIVDESQSEYWEGSYINLSNFQEAIIELEAHIQLLDANNKLQSSSDLGEILYRHEDLPEFVSEFLCGHIDELVDYYMKNKEIYGFFCDYLLSFINNGTLIWQDFPIIPHKNTFNSFLDVVENEGLKRALNQYRSDVQYVSILCKNGELTDEMVLEILDRYIELHDIRAQEGTDVTYYSVYPIPPIKKQIDLLKSCKTNSYLHIERDISNFISNIYLKGVHVVDGSIVIPFAIAGIEIENIFFNIKSDNYELDVSRNSFDLDSRRRLASEIVHIIYEDLVKEKNFDKDETELIKLFFDTYYS